MKISQHRTLVENLTTEAAAIKTELLAELAAEGFTPEPAEADAIVWTGQIRIFGQTVWHEFKTPGSWDGITYYRLGAAGGLKSREPEDFNHLDPNEG